MVGKGVRGAARTERSPPGDLGGQVSGGAGWREHKWEKEEKTKFDSFLRVYQVGKAGAASC